MKEVVDGEVYEKEDDDEYAVWILISSCIQKIQREMRNVDEVKVICLLNYHNRDPSSNYE